MTPEQEIEVIACRMLKACVDDYHTAVWNKIRKDVITDVKESVENIDENGFTDGDIALAIGRALVLKISQ